MFDDVLKHRSGRVIALCRAALAGTFLLALWIDSSQPAQAAGETYALLGAYVITSVAFLVFTWNDWWRDAQLAGPAHVLDILVFTFLVLATEGYTSPFFIFFVFLILSAAIRWGWRETAVTAVAVVTLYMAAGFIGAPAQENFELQRFIVRSGHLVILSAILIWFGVNQGFSGLNFPRTDFLDEPLPGESPIASAAAGAMKLTGAARALLVWNAAHSHEPIAITVADGKVTSNAVTRSSLNESQLRPLLFDLERGRAIARTPHRRLIRLDPEKALPEKLARAARIEEGIAIPIRTDAGAGMLLLCEIEGMCTDHLEFGEFVGSALAAHIQRHALLTAVEDTAAARSRLSLARDLHDSIVQFLAGATFRIEAIKRELGTGSPADQELDELKQLLLLEQQELRSSIGALRKERIMLPELASDLRSLCDRLARQWDIKVQFAAKLPPLTASMRLHLDTHQIIRESVANAVRHAGAKLVDVRLGVSDNDLRLDINDDGTGTEELSEGSPWSLRERIDEANGTLMLASYETGTSLSITLPLTGDLHA